MIDADQTLTAAAYRLMTEAVRGHPGVWPLYKQSNLIERFFNKIKHFRRIATRYEKRASNDLPPISGSPPSEFGCAIMGPWPSLRQRSIDTAV